MIKVAKSEVENSKVAIRNQRRDANAMLKEFCNEKEISQDDLRRGEEIIQSLTNSFINKIDSLLDKKEKAISNGSQEKSKSVKLKLAICPLVWI